MNTPYQVASLSETTSAHSNPKANYAHLVIISHESVGEKMAGPGIRAWELARALGRYGVPVTLLTPLPSERQASNVEICHFAWDDPSSLQRQIEDADVILATGPVLSRVVRVLGKPIEKPVIVDTYYVPEIEEVLLHLTTRRYDFDPTPAYIQEMFTYLRQGDYFLCALESQRDFFLGALMAAGRINGQTLRDDFAGASLIGIVPLGLPDDPPLRGPNRMKGVIQGIEPSDKVIFWGGGIWDWMDPLSLMGALKLVIRERDDIRVVFGSLHHFSKGIVPEMSIARQLISWIEREQWLGKYVFFQDWIPYDDRGSALLEADLGITLGIDTIESRYAVRARLMDFLWAGLPCVLTRGDAVANLLGEVGLADLVQPKDENAVAQAILNRLEAGQFREDGLQEASSWINPLKWSNCVNPILDFLKAPRMAADGENARASLNELVPIHKAWEALRQENEAQREVIRALRARKFDRIAHAFGRLLHGA